MTTTKGCELIESARVAAAGQRFSKSNLTSRWRRPDGAGRRLDALHATIGQLFRSVG